MLFSFFFRGAQAQVNSFPHLEDFENEFQCPANQCNPLCNLIGAWRNTTGDNLEWVSDRNDTPTGSTGPATDHTFGTTSGTYVYIESSCNTVGYPTKRADLLSPYYDFRGLTGTLKIEFWYHMYGSSMGTMSFDFDTTQGISWNLNIVPAWTANTNAWQKKQIIISQFAGKDSVRFRIRGITGTDAYSDMAVDDILVFKPFPIDMGMLSIGGLANQCALTANEPVQITVYNYGRDTLFTGDSIPACFQVLGQSPICQSFILAANLPPSTSLNLSFSTGANLSIPGQYSISAWTQKPGDGYAPNNTKVITITHFPIVTNLPYFENFENGPALWRSESISGVWSFGTPQKTTLTSAASGNNAWVTGGLNSSYSNGDESWVIGPCLNLSGKCNPWIDLDVWWKTESRFDGAVLQYSLNGGQTWSRLGNSGDPNNWFTYNNIVGNPGGQVHGWTGNDVAYPASAGWVTARHAMGLGGQTRVLLRMAFGAEANITDEGFAFDNVVVYDQVWLGENRALCLPSGNVTLDARGQAGWTYLWSTAATTQSINVSTLGTYSVRVTNGGCIRYDTVVVSGIGAAFQPTLGPDSTVCGSYLLNPSPVPQSSWLWSTLDSTPTLLVQNSGMYFADVSTPCGTFRSDTANVTVQALPIVELGPDTTICGSILLDAGPGAASYSWLGGNTTQIETADTTGQYRVTVTSANGCAVIDSVFLNVNPLPTVFLGPDTAICAGDTLCVTAGPDPTANYIWNTGPNSQNRCLTTSGVWFVTVTSTQNCVASDTLFLDIPNPPIASFLVDTSNCPILSFTNNSGGGTSTSWYWNFGDGNNSTLANPTHDYSIAGNGIYTVTFTATNACGVDSANGFAIVQCTIARGYEKSNFIEWFPNPNQGRLLLRSEITFSNSDEIKIRDAQGKEIFSSELQPETNNQEIFWNEKGLSNGVYFLEIKIANQKMTGLILLNIP